MILPFQKGEMPKVEGFDLRILLELKFILNRDIQDAGDKNSNLGTSRALVSGLFSPYALNLIPYTLLTSPQVHSSSDSKTQNFPV